MYMQSLILHVMRYCQDQASESRSSTAQPTPDIVSESPSRHLDLTHRREQRVIAAMPTPESEMFLAKKPKVPPTFEGVDFDDNIALKAAQDAIIREQWVKSMMARLVRDEMGKCYRREGVNHLEKCGHLRGMGNMGVVRSCALRIGNG